MKNTLPALGVFLLISYFDAAFANDSTEPSRTMATSAACEKTNTFPFAFWIGKWDVFAEGKLDGHSYVESTLQGCAAIEHWHDSAGWEGMSLIYFEPHAHQWKQVWLTDHASTPGGTKEKTLIFASADSVRFQGTIWLAPERSTLDRTTLRKMDGGRVGQIIETSKDGGTTWNKIYDATYEHAAATPSVPPSAK